MDRRDPRTSTRPAERRFADLTPGLQAVLQTMRQALADGAGTSGVDLFATCELLALDRHTAVRTYATALALGLGQALGRPPHICSPGTPGLSFDELWVLRLVERSHASDAESVAFLISSRIGHPCRSAIAFLVAGLADRICPDEAPAAARRLIWLPRVRAQYVSVSSLPTIDPFSRR